MKTPRLIVTLCLMLVLEAMIAETFSIEEEGLQKRGKFTEKLKNLGTKIKGAFGKLKNKIKNMRTKPQPEEQPDGENQGGDEASEQGDSQQYLK